MTIIKRNNVFIIKDIFGESITFNILGHSYCIEELIVSVIPESYTAVSLIIKLSDYILMVEVMYHPVRCEGRCEHPREPEGSSLTIPAVVVVALIEKQEDYKLADQYN
jgi:hypothetical protein